MENKPKFCVVVWHSSPIYKKSEAVRIYDFERNAQKYADKLNANGGNYVVRSTNYMQ